MATTDEWVEALQPLMKATCADFHDYFMALPDDAKFPSISRKYAEYVAPRLRAALWDSLATWSCACDRCNQDDDEAEAAFLRRLAKGETT